MVVNLPLSMDKCPRWWSNLVREVEVLPNIQYDNGGIALSEFQKILAKFELTITEDNGVVQIEGAETNFTMAMLRWSRSVSNDSPTFL